MLAPRLAGQDETGTAKRSVIVNAVVMTLPVVAVTTAVKTAVTERETRIANAAVGMMPEAVLVAMTRKEIVNVTRKVVRLCAEPQVRARKCDAETDVIVTMNLQTRADPFPAATMPMSTKVVSARHLQWEPRLLPLLPRHLLCRVMKTMYAAGDRVETGAVDLTTEIANASAEVTAEVTATIIAKAAAVRHIASEAVQIPKTILVVMETLEVREREMRINVLAVGREVTRFPHECGLWWRMWMR